MRGRGEAGTGTIAGDLARRAAAWLDGRVRFLVGCLVIFAIGIGFGIAFRVARSDGHPRPTTVLKVDRGTTVGTGGGGSLSP